MLNHVTLTQLAQKVAAIRNFTAERISGAAFRSPTFTVNARNTESDLLLIENEKDRLVRAWISPHGRSVHLEIGGTQVFAAAADIRENRWYHVCQSWENQAGRYAMWINGQLWVHGRSEKVHKRQRS